MIVNGNVRGVGMSAPLSEVGGETHLFDVFRDGYEAFQARDQFVAELHDAENDLLDLIRAGAVDDLDAASDTVLPGHEAIAQSGLFLAVSKIKLERIDETFAEEKAALHEGYFGKEVYIEPVDPKTRPITRYYYSGGLAGSRRYEPADVFRQRAHGMISGFDRRRGALWVTSKIGTGRVGRFFGDPYKWSVNMINHETGEPLVTIDFVKENIAQ